MSSCSAQHDWHYKNFEIWHFGGRWTIKCQRCGEESTQQSRRIIDARIERLMVSPVIRGEFFEGCRSRASAIATVTKAMAGIRPAETSDEVINSLNRDLPRPPRRSLPPTPQPRQPRVRWTTWLALATLVDVVLVVLLVLTLIKLFEGRS